MDVKLTQWNKFGDHPLVKENVCKEFEYLESAAEGCGFIDTFNIVRPGSYILEINDVFVAVVSEIKAKLILNDQSRSKKPELIRKTGKN